MRWWPFRRPIKSKVEEVDRRIEEKTEMQREDREQLEDMQQRLRMLEMQAEVLARQHLRHLHGN